MDIDDRFASCGYDLRALRPPFMMFVAELTDEYLAQRQPQSILPGYVSYSNGRAINLRPMYHEHEWRLRGAY